MLYAAFTGYWEASHRVQFLGEERIILVPDTVGTLDIKSDVYSSWKEWLTVQGNARYPAALRTIGGDTTGPGQRAGDLYFCINGWRVAIDQSKTRVNGVLFSDDYDTPWIDYYENPVYPATVASLVNTAETSVPVVTGDLDSLDVPTVAQIVAAVIAQLNNERIPVNVKQINDILVGGSGVAGDTWGPA